ncbi:hypothetical protein [Micromonospora sp. NPDC047730]|uniref:hypothetical protein n=1 Tax=Micromonospora sp. NPDC047730 TaxID=3364253 RepID=UPI003711B175
MGGKLHENPHVERVLVALDTARREANLAGHPYDIGFTGVDEPYGMIERALKRTLTHAFPDVDADAVYHALIDSGEDIGYCVDALRREKADRAKLLDPYREYERPAESGRYGARMWELPNGWGVSLVPYARHDEEAERHAIAREDFGMAIGAFVGGGFVIDNERSATIARVGGLDFVETILSDTMELPPR